jgi:3-methyladenine DNA glycosylase AlkD
MSADKIPNTAEDVRKALKEKADPDRAIHAKRFFKTGKGEYGEGDAFIGVTVPALRALINTCRNLPVDEIICLLRSKIHEERLLALFLLVDRFKNGGEEQKKRIYDLYLANTKHINNWDLVDSSAHLVVGAFLDKKDTSILYDLAASTVLWERRIAVLATFHFIRRNKFDLALKLFARLLTDKEDLMHKAVGWMLREIGKRDQAVLESFLTVHCRTMPRTMLRYAIERFTEEKRARYLRGDITAFPSAAADSPSRFL